MAQYETYALCPRCGRIVEKRTVTGDSSATTVISYVKGPPCEGGCMEKKADYAEVRREKK